MNEAFIIGIIIGISIVIVSQLIYYFLFNIKNKLNFQTKKLEVKKIDWETVNVSPSVYKQWIKKVKTGEIQVPNSVYRILTN